MIEWLFACGWQTNPGRFWDAPTFSVATWNVISESGFLPAGSPATRISGASYDVIGRNLGQMASIQVVNYGFKPGFFGKWLSYVTVPFRVTYPLVKICKITCPLPRDHFKRKGFVFQPSSFWWKTRCLFSMAVLFPLRWHLKIDHWQKEIPDLETIIFRVHVGFPGCKPWHSFFQLFTTSNHHHPHPSIHPSSPPPLDRKHAGGSHCRPPASRRHLNKTSRASWGLVDHGVSLNTALMKHLFLRDR